jgi:hypothetical protein
LFYQLCLRVQFSLHCSLAFPLSVPQWSVGHSGYSRRAWSVGLQSLIIPYLSTSANAPTAAWTRKGSQNLTQASGRGIISQPGATGCGGPIAVL